MCMPVMLPAAATLKVRVSLRPNPSKQMRMPSVSKYFSLETGGEECVI